MLNFIIIITIVNTKLISKQKMTAKILPNGVWTN